MKPENVLVTGATGFVGANLVRRLVKLNYNVSIIIRKSSNTWRIRNILKYVSVFYVDLLDIDNLKKVIHEINPQIIFHLATYGGHPNQINDVDIINTNILGTANLLEACSKIDYKLFVNTGSSSEYGKKDEPMKESDILEPINTYGVTKAAATLYCNSIAKAQNKPIITFRLFSPFGYYEEENRLIPYVIINCLKNNKLCLGDKNSARDFIFIEDVVNAYVSLINSTQAFKGEIINIGFGQQHTVGYIVKTITNYMNYKGKISWSANAGRSYDSTKWQADISKALDVLNWKPNYSIEDGLIKTVDCFTSNNDFYL